MAVWLHCNCLSYASLLCMQGDTAEAALFTVTTKVQRSNYLGSSNYVDGLNSLHCTTVIKCYMSTCMQSVSAPVQAIPSSAALQLRRSDAEVIGVSDKCIGLSLHDDELQSERQAFE